VEPGSKLKLSPRKKGKRTEGYPEVNQKLTTISDLGYLK
jgi:hypothetical protein